MKSESKPVRSRHAAREAAFKAVYAIMVGGMELADALEAGMEGCDYAPETQEWIRNLVGPVAGGGVLWDDKYKEFLTASWTLERLALTDKACLRMACFELWNLPETPPKVTLSEYVGLAKRYGDKESGKFVNGVLAAVLRASPKAEWAPGQEFVVEKQEPAPKPEEPEVEEPKPATAWVLKSDG